MSTTTAPALTRNKPDRLHRRLKEKVEVRTTRWLWTPADKISFTPRLSSTIYGDGRALFHVLTINNRPAFWVVRCDSTWDQEDRPSFGEFTDEILTDLEDEFGNARCGYSGANLYLPKKDRGCDCEECSDRTRAKWPAVDGAGGCLWRRVEWPRGASP